MTDGSRGFAAADGEASRIGSSRSDRSLAVTVALIETTLHRERLHLSLYETQPGVWIIDHTSQRHVDLAI